MSMGDATAASVASLSRFQITTFFSKNAPLTQQQCDQEAERILGMPVHSTSVQGGASYTVVSNDDTCVVQFRSGSSALDINLLKCVELAYDGFTPHHEFIGMFGQLYVYKMGNIGGISMYLARKELLEINPALLRQTVSDYARFFASPWHKTPAWMECPDRVTMYKEYSSGLVSLRQGLPERFSPTLDMLISKLPRLFDDSWPMVPHHTDLLENNIHVFPQTGRIAGICDWKDTIIGPFGVSLGGLETMLGIWIWEEGWLYHANQQELRDLFWESFYEAMGNVTEEQKELIEVARLVGLFLDCGFKVLEDGTKVPDSEGEIYNGSRYLEVVTLKLWASQASHQ